MLEIFKIIVPVLTSLAVCYITLYFSGKRNNEALQAQKKNHIENLKLSEKKYQEQLLINEQSERLKYLPYLSLEPRDKINTYEGNMEIAENIITIPLKIKNEGAGIAFSIQLRFLDMTKDFNYAAVSINNNGREKHNILGVRDPIDKDILRVEKQTKFCLYLTAVDKKFHKVKPYTDIKWSFGILFCDIQGRNYVQEYTFYTSTQKNKIFRVNSQMPQLIE
ncbi:hypothetical protein [Enterococcus lactis]|uniref:hypothetical protein n=1 Tax=Enterococcus lactis TaxID=357441 RepID=UPI00237A4186|nr:hypothetical protein [Enterococcus lactis]